MSSTVGGARSGYASTGIRMNEITPATTRNTTSISTRKRCLRASCTSLWIMGFCRSAPNQPLDPEPFPQGLKPTLYFVCPAGDMFYISDRAHTLHSRSDFWGLVLHFCRRSRRGGGNVGIPAFGISIFPSPNHLPLDLHPKVAPPAVCACRGEQWV